MSATIHWTLYVQARTEEGVRRVLSRFGDAVGMDINIETYERYRKDSALLLWAARLTSALDVPDAMAGVFQTLRIAGRIAPRWSVGSPSEYESGHWSFAGWMDTRGPGHSRVAGIHEAGFETCNFPLGVSAPAKAE